MGKTLEFLVPLFNLLGNTIGTTLGAGLRTAVEILSMFFNLLKSVFQLIRDPDNYKDIFKQYGESVKKDAQQIADTWKNAGGQYKDAVTSFTKPAEKVNDAIVTKDGRVLKTSPQDTIIATKNPGGMGGKQVSVSVSFGDFHVTTTEGNAVRAGQNVIKGVEQQIKNILLQTLTNEGAI
jgi:hypothetical protein